MSTNQEAEVGRLSWEHRDRNRFVSGSQGVEYALVARLRNQGMIEAEPAPPSLRRDDRLAVVSGSVSPISAQQINWARDNGFATVRLDAAGLLGPRASEAVDEALEAAKKAMERGTPPIVLTAEGTSDKAVEAVRRAAAGDMDKANDLIGRALGRIMRTLVEDLGLRRIVVSGGDTSSRVCEALGISRCKPSRHLTF